MIKSFKDQTFFFTNINYGTNFLKNYWNQIYDLSQNEGRFHINIARRFNKNRFVARAGSWPTPWTTQIPLGFQIPNVTEDYNKSFDEITHARALEINDIIQSSDARVAVFYSGGIDSVICLAALIQNLSATKLKKIDVCMSSESVIENPLFFEKYILNKFTILDSSKISYRDIELCNNFAITCDQGDSLFGTELATEFYNKNSVSDVESDFNKYADQLIQFFNTSYDPQFGTIFYERIKENIRSAKAPVFSLHDFFWWIIFNLKYVECAFRGPIFYYQGLGNRKKAVETTVINWFHTENYQKWSLVNNNNGQKIRGHSVATYKWAGRKFIHSFDKNDWYFRHKLKLSSLINISKRNVNRSEVLNTFAMNEAFDLISLSSPEIQNAIASSLR